MIDPNLIKNSSFGIIRNTLKIGTNKYHHLLFSKYKMMTFVRIEFKGISKNPKWGILNSIQVYHFRSSLRHYGRIKWGGVRGAEPPQQKKPELLARTQGRIK